MPYNVQKLADFAVHTRSTDISDAAWSAAERCLIDTLAAILGGVSSKNAGDIRTATFDVFGSGDFHPWFNHEKKLHYLGALLSNCAAASALDIDDGHRGAAGHPGAAIIPAVLMEAERQPISGQDLLAAIIIGYDVALRVASARHHHSEISFASGVWTCYGVAAALGRLRQLPVDQVAHAIAIAGAEAPQNLPQGACTTSSVKGSSPWSTVTAAVAVARAAAGAAGSLDSLNRDKVYDTAAMTKALGTRWLITETYLKPYASCRYTHPVMDAILEIKREMKLDLSSIQSFNVEIFPEASKLPNTIAPTSLEDAQFSVPFCAALTALRGASAFRPLKPESLTDRDVLALSERIKVDFSTRYNGAFPSRTPARVTIAVAGNEASAEVNYPLGDPQNALDADALIQKLLDFGKAILPQDKLLDILKKCSTLRSSQSDELIGALHA